MLLMLLISWTVVLPVAVVGGLMLAAVILPRRSARARARAAREAGRIRSVELTTVVARELAALCEPAPRPRGRAKGDERRGRSVGAAY